MANVTVTASVSRHSPSAAGVPRPHVDAIPHPLVTAHPSHRTPHLCRTLAYHWRSPATLLPIRPHRQRREIQSLAPSLCPPQPPQPWYHLRHPPTTPHPPGTADAANRTRIDVGTRGGNRGRQSGTGVAHTAAGHDRDGYGRRGASCRDRRRDAQTAVSAVASCNASHRHVSLAAWLHSPTFKATAKTPTSSAASSARAPLGRGRGRPHLHSAPPSAAAHLSFPSGSGKRP